MAELGIRPGCGVVCLAVGQSYLAYVALAALARLGVPASPPADTAADLCLTDHGDPPERRGLIQLTPAWVATMFSAEPIPLPALELDLDATGRVMLSSGTTGQPHRIAVSWRRLETRALTNLRLYGAGKLGTWFPMTGADSLLGFSQIMLAWAVGAAVGGGIEIAALPGRLEALPDGVVGMTPIQLTALLAALPPAFQNKPGWRLVIGGSILPPSVAREAAQRITPDVRNVYGATEANQIGSGPVWDTVDEPGCAGETCADGAGSSGSAWRSPWRRGRSDRPSTASWCAGRASWPGGRCGDAGRASRRTRDRDDDRGWSPCASSRRPSCASSRRSTSSCRRSCASWAPSAASCRSRRP